MGTHVKNKNGNDYQFVGFFVVLFIDVCTS